MSELHLSLSKLEAGLNHIQQSPPDEGIVEAIVIRPQTGKRVSLQECELSPEQGVHGDSWVSRRNSLSLEDGRPNPKSQVSIMNSRVAGLIAQSKDRWPLAGDNLFVDLDLSKENLPIGQRLSIGSAILEVTEIPHTGCAKFAERFGTDALRLVNNKKWRQLNLRGIYRQIVQAGTIKVGDTIKKLRRKKSGKSTLAER